MWGSFLGRPVAWPSRCRLGGFCKEVCPVGGFGPFDGFEVAELGWSCRGVGVGGP